MVSKRSEIVMSLAKALDMYANYYKECESYGKIPASFYDWLNINLMVIDDDGLLVSFGYNDPDEFYTTISDGLMDHDITGLGQDELYDIAIKCLDNSITKSYSRGR